MINHPHLRTSLATFNFRKLAKHQQLNDTQTLSSGQAAGSVDKVIAYLRQGRTQGRVVVTWIFVSRLGRCRNHRLFVGFQPTGNSTLRKSRIANDTRVNDIFNGKVARGIISISLRLPDREPAFEASVSMMRVRTLLRKSSTTSEPSRTVIAIK